MTMRSSDMVLAAMLAASVAVGATWVASAWRVRAEQPEVQRRAALVEQLGLTDLALFTEARYTRHPSQSDRHAAFQDHPFALEHFPSGSVLPPRRQP
ncbi:hypothetical protein MSR1_19530 [Magnetospirillum gryphiswaldense MSR-1]|uniref:Uncharacterized protein n=3 Tax=Magnetospirillum gryphiswaldense TaxID=55518 RepID=V6EW97_MAGGM|nr:hypothetical protein MSR1_19530 [Magnetospirillum gryphiswaldense MSR-1]AVM78345.1 hypothetical protein MSR1L_19530 [Magnetospirillum gryphiswaldense]CAM74222.1 conserved hypothetical protein, membrane or secreted [Magnetospirillum gryphiswaldense MSR-1]CDK97464.1 protein of unknown function [Magnetospirillum gryphiswaldense MSR-1 v2]